jgi:hypothetical protein
MAAADYHHFTTARPEAVFAALIRALPPLNGHVHSVEGFGTSLRFSMVADSPHDACQMRASVAPSGAGTLVSITSAEPVDALGGHDTQLPLRALDRLFVEVDRKVVAPYHRPDARDDGGPVTR